VPLVLSCLVDSTSKTLSRRCVLRVSWPSSRPIAPAARVSLVLRRVRVSSWTSSSLVSDASPVSEASDVLGFCVLEREMSAALRVSEGAPDPGAGVLANNPPGFGLLEPPLPEGDPPEAERVIPIARAKVTGRKGNLDTQTDYNEAPLKSTNFTVRFLPATVLTRRLSPITRCGRPPVDRDAPRFRIPAGSSHGQFGNFPAAHHKRAPVTRRQCFHLV
jgi:hypothetical protein